MNATAAIAQHLNVNPSAILEVQEWARVLWVRIKGIGARFVSKKVVQVVEVREELSVAKLLEMGSAWNKNGYNRIYFESALIADLMGLSNSKTRKISGDKFWYDCEDGKFHHRTNYASDVKGWPAKIRELCTVTVQAESQQDRAFALISGMHQTRSGAWVDGDKWETALENGIDL